MVTASGGILAYSPSGMGSSPQSPGLGQASPISDGTLLYQAVSSAYRGEVMAATADRLSRYTITATFHPPGALRPDMPLATPQASPAIASGATPIATPVARVEAIPLPPT